MKDTETRNSQSIDTMLFGVYCLNVFLQGLEIGFESGDIGSEFVDLDFNVGSVDIVSHGRNAF